MHFLGIAPLVFHSLEAVYAITVCLEHFVDVICVYDAIRLNRCGYLQYDFLASTDINVVDKRFDSGRLRV